MNISEFEKLLRDDQTPGHFPPSEAGWRKLEQDLKGRKRALVLPVVPAALKWSAAAGVALLLAIGLYTQFDKAPHKEQQLAAKGPAESGEVSTPADSSFQPADGELVIAPVRNSNIAQAPRHIAQAPVTPVRQSSIQSVAADSSGLAVTAPLPESASTPRPARTELVDTHREPQFDMSDPGPQRPERKLQFGVAAQYGRSDISSGQYRLALDARRNISERFFAAVQVNASAAAIASNNDIRYQAVSIDANGYVAPVRSQQATANYRGNIYTVGIAPSLGIRAGKKLALSAGADLQKRLSGALTLDNKAEFQNPLTLGSLIDERKQVADLDFGLQSAAQVDVNRRLAVTLMYRYGLTNYLLTSEGTVKNSYISAGLSYRLSR